ncbi:hypothetical protein RGUI_2205 [Rhodovulum sp. P5]|uniref:hypothetical protein n=1 Tax=Rhodovulum sp. P5 TaxID=1564506 RepID=UPI0009C343A4|nr:hypothetical protein [Rhodovulum sp. P5]ARE40346.1 hypothetical protein RGUI_2205 [Rhodovulum sp. P5]
MKLKVVLGGLALAGLAACVETVETVDLSTAPGNTAEANAQQACLRGVANYTGNSDVRVKSSSFSEAGTEVIVGVGPTGLWRCIAYRDGSTTGITSLNDEGAL